MAKKDWTTILVQKTTRDLIKQIAEKKGTTQDDVVINLINSMADSSRQILLNIDREVYNMLEDVAKFLYVTKCINKPDVNEAARFGINNLIQGVTQSVQTSDKTGSKPVQ